MTTRTLILVALSTAAAAQTVWRPRTPWPRYDTATFDRARLSVVAFSATGTLWENDGDSWREISATGTAPTTAPFARFFPALGYDELRRRVVLFGGSGNETGGSAFGDTWFWDGETWERHFSTLSPPRRWGAALVFDGARGELVLFGGNDLAVGTHVDTWIHDGVQWLRRMPATQPTPWRSEADVAMACDRARGECVAVLSDRNSVQAWTWDGTDWTAAPAPDPVMAERELSMAYDEVRQRTVLISGSSQVHVSEWDGTSWTAAVPQPSLPGTTRSWTWYDPSRARVVHSGSSLQAWTWNGTAATPAPGWREVSSPMLAWDPANDRVLAAGSSTWTWDGIRWQQLTTTQQPPARWLNMLTTDTRSNRCYLFSGADGATMFDDLWSWDGTDWTNHPRQPAAQWPPGRVNGAMTHDPVRDRLVLFGGQAGSTVFNDTWEWDGVSWTGGVAPSSPTPRIFPAMAFDPTAGNVLLALGISFTPTTNDSFRWDGQTWTAGPPVGLNLLRPQLTFDPDRNKMVMVGGPDPLRLLEFDGSTWQEVSSYAYASSRLTRYVTPAALFDTRRGRLIVASYPLHEATDLPAEVAARGSGCGAPAPALRARALPRVGDDRFGLEASATPGDVVLFALSTGTAPTTITPGCTLELRAPLALSFAVAAADGGALQPLPVPPLPALRGLAVFAQAAALQPATNTLALTRALDLRLGD